MQGEQIKFQTSSQIESVSTRADNTIKVVISTQELQPSEAAALFSLKGKQGWMLFSENALKESDIPEDPAPEFEGQKTLSERQRDVMWLYWDKKTDKKKPFEEFRREKMEGIIEFWKGKLD